MGCSPGNGENHSPRGADLLLCPTGVWNDYPGDDFKTPSGTVIPQGSTEEELFHYGMTCEKLSFRVLGYMGQGQVVSLRPVGTGPLSFMREGWKSAEDTVRTLVPPQICPLHSLPPMFLYLKEDEGNGWPSVTRAGISRLRSWKPTCLSMPLSPTPSHIK